MNVKPIFVRIAVTLFFLNLWLIPQAARGQTLYWDLPGGANASPSGPWDTTSTNWSANPNGGSQTTWLNGSSAFFSANELGATDSYTITLATSVTVGDLTYTGGNVNTSALQIAVGTGTTITMQNPVMNVAVDGGTVLVIAPVIAGAGNLNLTGGTLILTGANTYSGGTTITTAILQIGNGGTTGSILGQVTDNSSLTFVRSDTMTFSNNISGTGSVTQNGTGTVALTGVNSYTGGTVLFGGVPFAVGGKLSVASDAELGDPAGGITMNGGELLTTADGFSTARSVNVGATTAFSTLAAATGTTATYTGLLSGPGGGLTIGDAINKGTVVFTENNSYSGTTTISTGVTLQLGIGGTTGSVVGTSITDRGILAFDRSDPITFAVPIAGAGLNGSISQIGSGTLTLTGTNTYRGGTSVSGNGTISVATDANLGATTGPLGAVTLQNGELLTTGTTFNTARGITLNAALSDDTLAAANNTTATYTGVVSGAGGLTVGDGTNTGTVVLTGTNTYSFGNTITRALTTLQIGNGGATGSIIGNVADSGIVAFDRSDPFTFSGTVSGTGSLSQIGSGTLILTGANTYSGGTLVSGGKLSVDTDGELGLTTGGITLQGGELLTTTDGFTTARSIDISPTGTPDTLAATNGTTATYTGVVSDTGGLTVGDATSTGTVVFTGINSYSGGTTINSGTLQLGDGVTNGSILGNVIDNGTFAFNPNGSVTFNGAITGAGNLAKLGTGTVILTANNSYAGTTTISAGTLQLGNGGATGSIVGNVVDNGNLAFDRTDVVTLPGDTSGTGSLSQIGSGTLILTGANTYNGGTTISAGILQVGNGGATGNIVGDVINNGALAFDRSGTVTLDGAVSGTGTLSQAGSGTLVLTGPSTYTGATTVSAGTLEVDGVLGNTAVTVQSAAVLSGNGTIGGGVTIQNGGHLAPGPGAATLGVGSLSLSSGSVLDYVLSTFGGGNTLVDVGGNLTLAGILNVTNGGGFGQGFYRLINYTGDLSGTTLTLGTLPTGFNSTNVTVSTATANQVNLIVGPALALEQFWDGPNTTFNTTGPPAHGGSGTWDNTTTNFNDNISGPNAAWLGGNAVFGTVGGTVTLGANIAFQGIEFAIGGYTIAGGGFTLNPTGTAMITTDLGVSASISAPIIGTVGLNKEGPGTLILSGPNTYSGGTTITAGILSVTSDTNLGGAGGGITLQGGELLTTGPAFTPFTTARGVVLDATGPGSFDTLAALTGTTATYTGVISGVNSPTIGDGTNNGIVILTATNTYTGGTTTITTGATLQLGNGLTTGSIFGNVIDNGNFVFNRSDSGLSFSGNISGTGTMSQIGSGTTALTGVNTYSGATTVSAGTLLANSTTALSPNSAFTVNSNLDLHGHSNAVGSLAGSGNVNNNFAESPAILTAGGNNTSTTFSGILTNGNGNFLGLTKVGLGTMTLTGTNTYTGGTIINGGILQIGNAGTSGSIVGTVTDNANLSFNRSDIITFSNIVSGLGSLSQIGTGTLILTGSNTYLGGTTISAGILQIGNGGTIGSITGNVTDNSHLAFERSDTLLTFPGNISGTGTLSQLGLGTLALSGVNTYSGVTTVSFGTLQAATTTAFSPNSAFTVNTFLDLNGHSNTIGSLAGSGNVTTSTGPATLTAGGDGTNTIFSGTLTDGPLTFSLGLIKTGNGTLTLTGANTYTGGTTIRGGTLQIGNGGTTGSIVGNVTDNSNLLFDRSDAVTFPGIVSGTGTLTQLGSGTLTLPGANTYSGGTLIQSGTLVVDNAAALGTGNVSVNGGTLATEVRPINVLGNYTQNASGTLQLRVAGANVGQYDSLNVHGNASVGGTLQLISLGFAPVAGNQLSLVSTGGTVSGRFAHFVDPFVVGPAFNTIDLVYGLNSVVLKFLNVTTPISPVVSTIDFQSFAAKGTSNERASAGLLDQVELDPGAASVIGFLFKEPETNFLADFAKISPDVLSSLYEISFSNSNIQRLNLEDRLDAVRNGSNGFSSNMNLSAAKVYLEQDGSVDDGKADKSPVQPVMQPSPENRWGVWVSGFGDFVNVDGDGNGKGYDFTTGGVTVGIDFRLTDNLVVGLMGDYSHTWSDLKPGHLDVDSGRGGLYASWFDRGFYLDGAIYAGHNNYDTARSGLDGLASGGTEGSEWSAFLSGGYDFHVGHLTIGPIGDLQYTEVNIDGFSEKGSVAPMEIHDGSAESLRSDIGFRTFYQWQVGKVIIEPSLKAAWEHEYKYSALPITAGFAGVPGPSGTFFGPSEGHDSAVVDVGVSVQWTATLSTYLNYDGQLGRGNYDSNAVTGGVRVSF